MSIRATITAICDLSMPLTATSLRHALVSGDDQGDLFEVTILRNGEPVDLTGASVAGYFMQYLNGSTITIGGTVSGNKVSVLLTEACYGVPGRFRLTIKITQDGDCHAVYVADGTVLRM